MLGAAPGSVKVGACPATSSPSSSGGVDWPCSSMPQQTGVPSASSAQVWSVPALSATNVLPVGGDDFSWSSLPQHWGVPSSLSVQLCRHAHEIEAKSLPVGADNRSHLSLNPQQAMEPSVLIPHVCRSPALIAVNVASSGGVIWP